MYRTKDHIKAINRPHYPLPTVEDTITDLQYNDVCQSLMIRLALATATDRPLSQLTNINTPFGSYGWLREPFGNILASEDFQKRMNEAVEGRNIFVFRTD